MGHSSDPLAVVDQYGKVYGVDGLPIVDASIMPDTVWAKLNLTVIAMTERAADFIKEVKRFCPKCGTKTFDAGFASLASMTDQVAYGAMLGGVCLMILRGSLTVGSFAAYLSAAERFRYSMSWIGFYWMTLDADLRYLADLIDYLEISDEELLDAPSRSKTGEMDRRFLNTGEETPEVGFSRLSFAYPGTDTMVLDGLDLTISSCERVALVGRNGAGKSTLARLLFGLYRPTSGSVRVGGVDLRDIDPPDWRGRAAAVFQDYFRFDLTARENIGFVGALPKGYDTMLGRSFDEEGQDISEGQWQRLASARDYFCEASVLVLDESPSALDAKADVEVYRRFRDMFQGKSVLLISHRLGIARLADCIVFLEGGRIVEQGTHDELMALNGPYVRLYSIQANGTAERRCDVITEMTGGPCS